MLCASTVHFFLRRRTIIQREVFPASSSCNVCFGGAFNVARFITKHFDREKFYASRLFHVAYQHYFQVGKMFPFVIASCKISKETCCKADKIIIIDKRQLECLLSMSAGDALPRQVCDFGDRIENNKKLFQGQTWSGAIVGSRLFSTHSTSPIISLAWSLLVCSYLIHDNCFMMIIFCAVEQKRGFNVAKRSRLEKSLTFSNNS